MRMKQSGTKSFIFGIFVMVFLLAIVATPAHAQWAYAYGGTGYDHAYSVQQTVDGGYIVAGSTLSFGAGGGDSWIMKLDENGVVTWQKAYGTPGTDYPYSVRQTQDRGYIMVGYTAFGAGNGDAWIMKLDGSGNITWQKAYGGSGYDSAYSVQQTQDGGYIMAGGTVSFGSTVDIWLIKLDGSGNITWEKTYGGTAYDYAYSVQQTQDGGYIMIGRTSSFGAGSDDTWVLKLDGSGNITWQKAYGGAGDDRTYAILQTQDGGYIMTGETTSFSTGDSDIWLVKLDGSGNVTWQKTYGGVGDDGASSVEQTQDGGYIVAGSTDSFGMGSLDAWLLKLNSSGGVVWQNTYGSSGIDYAWLANQTVDGGYVVAGAMESLGDGNNDIWVLKLDSTGSIELCPFEGISTALITDTSATVIDTDAVPVTSTATVTNTTATVTDTNALPVSICGVSSGPERLKTGATRKKQGDGIITSLDGLIDCPDACETLYNAGIATILSATPSALSTFLGWKPASLGCEATNPVCQITMDKKKSVKAVFQGPNKLKVVTTFKNGGAGTVTSGDAFINCPGDCEELYILNAPVTLTANEGVGSTFVKWTGNPCKDQPTNVCTFTMEKNATVKAIFEPTS